MLSVLRTLDLLDLRGAHLTMPQRDEPTIDVPLREKGWSGMRHQLRTLPDTLTHACAASRPQAMGHLVESSSGPALLEVHLACHRAEDQV